MILKCIFGTDLSSEPIEFYQNNVPVKKSVSFVLRTCFQQSVTRFTALHVLMFPFMATYYVTPFEREL